jgi:hypothetical protein
VRRILVQRRMPVNALTRGDTRLHRSAQPPLRQRRAALQRLLCDLKETTRLPLLLAFVDYLGEFAKLLGLFVACLYL